jgi:hypothetical protein
MALKDTLEASNDLVVAELLDVLLGTHDRTLAAIARHA